MSSRRQEVLHQFGQNAEKYVTSTIHAKGKDLEVLVEIVKAKKKTGDLLDVATGGGHVANALAPFFDKVVAFDLTPQMLEAARKFVSGNGRANVTYVQGDAQQMPFPEQAFGTVTCRIAPHHFPDVVQFAKEVYRVLRDDGLFVLIDNVAPEVDAWDHFYNEVEKRRDPSHHRAYKKSEWIALLETEGFTIESLTTFRKTFVFDDWCERMALPEQEKRALNDYMISASPETIRFFAIEITDGQVQSFAGESILLVARKGNHAFGKIRS